MAAYPECAWLAMRLILLTVLWIMLNLLVQVGALKGLRGGELEFLVFLKCIGICFGMQQTLIYNYWALRLQANNITSQGEGRLMAIPPFIILSTSAYPFTFNTQGTFCLSYTGQWHLFAIDKEAPDAEQNTIR